MSSKNSRKTREKARAHDLQREQQAQQERALKLKSKKLKAAQSGGGLKSRPKKGIRIRKGVTIQGIKVVDSDTKKKVLKVLKKRAESKMQVDGDKPQRQKKQRKAPAKAAAPTAAMDTSS